MQLEDKKVIEELVKNEIVSLKKELALLKRQLQPVEKVCSLDGCYHESLYQEQSVLLQQYTNYTTRLTKLQSILPKIYDEEYGICQECEEDISLERLKLLPESLYCVTCMQTLGI